MEFRRRAGAGSDGKNSRSGVGPITDREPAAMFVAPYACRNRRHAIIHRPAILRPEGAVIACRLLVKAQSIAQLGHHADNDTGKFPIFAFVLTARCQAGFNFRA